MNEFGLNVAIFCLQMHGFTGSEIYFYELAKSLSYLGHNVIICTYKTSQFMMDKACEANFKIVNQKHLSILNDVKFDTLIISHWKVTSHFLNKIKFHSYSKFINICHSEMYDIEFPSVEKKFDAYVGVRKSITDLIKNDFGIDHKKVHLILNPFDTDKFNLNDVSNDNFGLFAGTFMELRKDAIEHFHYLCKERNLKSVFIGADHSNNFLYDETYPPRWDIEELVKRSTICGGIIYGRTYWEAKLCGKEVIEYLIDSSGKILSIINEPPPSTIEIDNLSKNLNNINIANKILNTVYSSI